MADLAVALATRPGPRAATSPAVVTSRPHGGAVAVAVPESVQVWLEGGMVTTSVGFDLEFEARQLADAARRGRQLLSIRLGPREALLGPRWVPEERVACAGCAETRMRLALGHPLAARGDVNTGPRTGWPAAVAELVGIGLDHLGRDPLAPGEMLAIGLSGTGRHRVVASVSCPICGHGTRPWPGIGPDDPGRLTLVSRPSPDPVPVRGAPSPAIDPERLAELVDPRVGPILAVQRDNKAPFAMAGALLPGSRAPGYGRGHHFEAATRVATLEAYERLGAVPERHRVIHDMTFRDVSGLAVDPDTLGRYSQAQLDHPNSRVLAYHPDVAMDWVTGHDLGDGTPRLVPADVAFYGYGYHDAGRPRDRFFAESSSGCALGSSLEEAALHALSELIERDAFLLSWCRRAPLPELVASSVADPTSAMLLEGIEARGFDVHLLVTTSDLALPSVWALAVNRSSAAIPATLSAAGSSAIPAQAVRAALWELAQLSARPVDWDLDDAQALVDDPSQVDTIDDHVHLYAMPAMRHRVCHALDGPLVSLGDAFPGWPEGLCRHAAGDVRGALDYLLAQTAAAGLDQAVVVDQSTDEHRDLGLSVARVVVPGMLPMCFGAPQQRFGGVARRQAVIMAAGTGRDPDTEALLDPHPFP